MTQTREKIDNKYKWDLERLYKNNEIWLEEYNTLQNEINKIKNYEGHILESSDNLLKLLEDENELDLRISRLYVYAKMRLDENTSNGLYQDYVGKATNIITKWSALCSFIEPELLSEKYDKVKAYINENKKLKTYQKLLEDIYRFKPHILSEKEENLLAHFSKILNSSEETSYFLRNTDMKFGKIKDENNKRCELTDANYSTYIRSTNRKVRKRAFNQMFKTYEGLINTYASTLKNTVELNNTSADIRNYENALQASLFKDNIEVKLYDKLIKEVNNKLPYLFKYYKLKRNVLKVEELHIYDLYTDLVKDLDKKYEYEDAKKLILESLSIFGEEYTNVLKKAFNENWIDVFENKGKKSGAYSWGVYGSSPYILTNYNYDYNSVSTLAHELGHSVHTYFSNENNLYHEANYPIFLAEIASTVNELLLAHYILDNSNDINEKKYIISNILELYRATIYRQTMFAEFEKDIHIESEQGTTLTSDKLSEIYFEKIKKYFEKNIRIDSKIKYEWARIPHFYDSFYVYKYATGLAIATYITQRIRQNDEKFKEKYINLLKSGGKDYPLELLKECDIDILNDNIISESLESFNNLIDEFNKLI